MSSTSSAAAIINYKGAILDALKTHRDYQKTQSDGAFRVAAYNKVIGKINGLDTIRSLADLEEVLPKTKGSEIRKKVIEVLETGSLASAEAIKANPTNDILELFQGIYGIGPKAAQELIDLGMKSIGDLRGHPELLNKKQAIGLKYYEEIKERIPRSEMVAHENLLLKTLPAGITGTIAGSYRRGKPSSGDVDLLLRSGDEKVLKEVVLRLIDMKYIIEVLASGSKKFMGICRLGTGVARRIDILLTSPEEYAYALLTFTGSDRYNVSVRGHALSLGYSLNEHGLTLTKKGILGAVKLPTEPLLTEEAVLGFLGLPYVKPEDREL